jgi:hypothetical protein
MGQGSFRRGVALADVAEDALRKAGEIAGVPPSHQFHDWHTLVHLDHLDVIDICTPNRLHTPIALAAAGRQARPVRETAGDDFRRGASTPDARASLTVADDGAAPPL